MCTSDTDPIVENSYYMIKKKNSNLLTHSTFPMFSSQAAQIGTAHANRKKRRESSDIVRSESGLLHMRVGSDMISASAPAV